MLSDRHFNLKPSHAFEVEMAILLIFVLLQLTSNQLLVRCNLKDFNSSTIVLGIIISLSRRNQSLVVVEEVQLFDICFTLVDDAFNLGDLYSWIEWVTVYAKMLISYHASGTITYCEANC